MQQDIPGWIGKQFGTKELSAAAAMPNDVSNLPLGDWNVAWNLLREARHLIDQPQGRANPFADQVGRT